MVAVTKGRFAPMARLGWGVADQGVSSLGNFAFSILVAKALSPTDFGAFALAWVTYGMLLNLSRGLATDPLVVRFSHADHSAWRGAVQASTGTSVAVGAVSGVVCVGVGSVLPQPLGTAIMVLGFVLPGLLLQDALRFASFAAGRPAVAFANDLVWAVLQTGTAAALYMTGHVTVGTAILAFGATALVAALVGWLQLRVLPHVGRVRWWFVTQRALGLRYAAENLSISGARQLRMTLLGAIAGLAAVGQVRAAEILMGPFMVILMGVSQVAVPEGVRVLQRPRHRLLRFSLLLGSVQALAACAWGAMMFVLVPRGLGELLLGELWVGAYALLLPVLINMVVGLLRERRDDRCARPGCGAPQPRGPVVQRRAVPRRRRRRRRPRRRAGVLLGRGLCHDHRHRDLVEPAAPGRARARVPRPPRRALSRPPVVTVQEAATSTSEIPVMTPSPEGRVPAVTIGLPGLQRGAVPSPVAGRLLAQTFSDFELVISDNASTDGTSEICREYAQRDDRIRYLRQPTNIGAGPNHNFLPARRGRRTSSGPRTTTSTTRSCSASAWRCSGRTRTRSLVHCWDARIDPEGDRLPEHPYTLDTANPSPAARLRSLLYTPGGDDFYGVIRTDVLNRIGPHGSLLQRRPGLRRGTVPATGPFYQVPEVLYFRREHPDRLSRARPATARPGWTRRGADPFRHPEARLYGEYVAGYYRTIRKAPLSAADRWRCNLEVTRWAAG